MATKWMLLFCVAFGVAGGQTRKAVDPIVDVHLHALAPIAVALRRIASSHSVGTY